MKDTEVLKKLYALQGLKPTESEKFIAKWINDTQIAIAKDSNENIGLGNMLKTMEKYIRKNERVGNGLDGMLKTSKMKTYILTDGAFAVKTKSDFKLPVITGNKETADRILGIVDNSKKECKKEVLLPTRAELDAIVKSWKAQPKDKRTKFPEYSFGKGLPTVNAETLFDLLTFFPMLNKGKVGEGTRGMLYMDFIPFEAVLMPLNKV